MTYTVTLYFGPHMYNATGVTEAMLQQWREVVRDYAATHFQFGDFTIRIADVSAWTVTPALY